MLVLMWGVGQPTKFFEIFYRQGKDDIFSSIIKTRDGG